MTAVPARGETEMGVLVTGPRRMRQDLARRDFNFTFREISHYHVISKAASLDSYVDGQTSGLDVWNMLLSIGMETRCPFEKEREGERERESE